MAWLRKPELVGSFFSLPQVPLRLHPPLLFERFLVAHQTKLEAFLIKDTWCLNKSISSWPSDRGLSTLGLSRRGFSILGPLSTPLSFSTLSLTTLGSFQPFPSQP
ncbi:unnamed protein product [Microthlaspi erraticum]|uniref:Uncharacterized protein n=1 Tax=Microthlaspi erraticum TaxID=1685480 RepID=A0A6D2KIY5_9BRAS|nr:unnamed protein product [Microthlaspi erraticum]